MRPIDADALIEDLRYDREYRWYGSAAYKKLYIDKSLYAEHRIEKAPTIDAEPVRHGHWIKVLGGNGLVSTIRCSECDNCDNPSYIPGNYCWFCGAKMDGEAE